MSNLKITRPVREQEKVKILLRGVFRIFITTVSLRLFYNCEEQKKRKNTIWWRNTLE